MLRIRVRRNSRTPGWPAQSIFALTPRKTGRAAGILIQLQAVAQACVLIAEIAIGIAVERSLLLRAQVDVYYVDYAEFD